MKKHLLNIAFIFFGMAAYCQTNDTSQAINNSYLEKSKKQRTTGLILLGGGAAAIGAGYIIAQNSSLNELGGPAMLVLAGIISTLASVPVFINSAKNKKLATTVSLINQNLNIPIHNRILFNRQLTLAVKIDF